MKKAIVVFALAVLASPFMKAQQAICTTVSPLGIPVDVAKGTPYISLSQVDTVELPLAVHIVRKTDGSNGLDPSQVNTVISNLNAAYAGGKIRFFLVQQEFIDNDSWANAQWTDAIEDNLASSYNVANAINIYFVPTYQGGRSTFSENYLSILRSHGVLSRQQQSIMFDNFIATSSTVPHEVGHYLNLFHTFENVWGTECPDLSNSSDAGDLITDTPAEPYDPNGTNYNYQCRFVRTQATVFCSNQQQRYDSAALTQINAVNFMSYSGSTCRSQFTTEQFRRIRTQLLTNRTELLRRWVQFTNALNGTNLGGSFLIDGSGSVRSGSYFAATDSAVHQARPTDERFGLNKHHDWNGDLTKYRLVTTFTVPSMGRRASNEARFSSLGSVNVRTTVVETGTLAAIDFRDPWYLADANGSQPNGFYPVTNASNYVPTGAYNQSTGGVFLNQRPEVEGIYYSVRAPITQPIGGYTAIFQGWSYDANYATLQQVGSNPSGFDQKAAVFSAAGATVTALYKAHLGSSLSSTTGLTSQRKLIYAGGKYHAVYESGGECWYMGSTDNGQTWSPELRLSRGSGTAHNPSISEPYELSTYVYVVWVDATNRAGATGYDINVKKFNLSTRAWLPTEALCDFNNYTGNGTANPNAHPVAVSYRQLSNEVHVVVAYEGTSSDIRYSLYGYCYYIGAQCWTTNVVPYCGTGKANPSMTLTRNAQGNSLALTYNDGSNIYLSQSGAFITSDSYPWISFNAPVVVASSSGSLDFTGNSAIDADITGGKHITWAAVDNNLIAQVVLERSVNANGNWTALNEFTDASGDSPTMTSSISGDGFIAGAALLYSDGQVLFNMVSSDGVNWASNGYSSPSAYSCPNLVPKTAGYVGSLVTQNWAAPYGVKFQIYDNSNRLPKTSGSASANVGKLVKGLYRRMEIAVPQDSAWLSIQFGDIDIEHSGGTVSLPFDKLNPKDIAESKSTFLHSSSFVLSASQNILADVSIRSKRWKSGGTVRLELRDRQNNELIANLAVLDCRNGSDGSTNPRLARGLTSNVSGKEVYLAVSLDDVDTSRMHVDYVNVMRMGSSIAFGKEQAEKERAVVQIPTEFGLSQNYPNPFNPTTAISYQLPLTGHVSLKVYDMLGREVAMLVDETKEAGYHTATFDASKFSSGLYFARLSVIPANGSSAEVPQGGTQADKMFVQTIKMLLTK